MEWVLINEGCSVLAGCVPPLPWERRGRSPLGPGRGRESLRYFLQVPGSEPGQTPSPLSKARWGCHGVIQADGAGGATRNCSRRAAGSSVCLKGRELWGPRLGLPWPQVLGSILTSGLPGGLEGDGGGPRGVGGRACRGHFGQACVAGRRGRLLQTHVGKDRPGRRSLLGFAGGGYESSQQPGPVRVGCFLLKLQAALWPQYPHL